MSDKKLNDLVGKMNGRGEKKLEDAAESIFDDFAGSVQESDIDPEALEILNGIFSDEELDEHQLKRDVAAPDEPIKPSRNPKTRQKQEQLPLWPNATKGVPNAVLRSALFGVVRKGRRNHCLDLEIPSAGSNLKITYTGMRLDQADLDVWEQCLTLAKDSGLGSRIEFSAYGFLKSIGRGTGQSQHMWLKSSLKRLNGALVEISEGDRSYFGTLIQEGFRDDKVGRYVIEVNPRISRLYGQHHWTRVQWDERHALKRPLAQWLHGFYSTHKKPFPIKVETIHNLCGSETKDLSRFRQTLRLALKEMQAVTGWQCWIDKTDKVIVSRHSK